MMKKSICLILVVVLLCGMVGTVSAYKFPNSFWPVNDKYVKALNSKDNAGIIQYGIESINLLEKEPVNTQTTDALGARYEQVAVAYEKLGSFEFAASYFEKLIQLQKNDPNVLYGQIRLNEMRVQQYTPRMSLYTDGGTPIHYGAVNEKVSGVLYGVCMASGIRSELPNATIFLTYQELGDIQTIDYNKQVLKDARETGAAVEFALNCPGQGNDIANIRQFTSYLEMLSDVMKEYEDVAVYLRFGAEFDAWAVPTTPDKFKDAFRYVSDLFKSRNPNVAMVWSPTVAAGWNMNVHDYYPGDQYVDWVGVSLYASPYYQSDKNADYINEIYFRKGIYADPVLAMEEFVTVYGNRKPIMISECGCGHTVSSTGENTSEFAVDYLKQYMGYLPMVYPQIKSIAYFDHKVGRDPDDYRLSTNPEMKNLFIKYTQNGVFAQDTFMDEADVIYRPIQDDTFVNPIFPVSTYVHRYNQKVHSVTYTIDSQWVATVTDPPFTAYIDASKFSHGKHQLDATANAEDGMPIMSTAYDITIGPMPVKGISVYVSDTRIEFDQWPVMYNDRTLVPMRKIFEALGATVSWDEATQTVTAVRGDRTIKLSIGSSVMDLNGETILLDTPSILLNDRTLVPVRAIAEGLGCTVSWDDATYTVTIVQ